MWPKDHLNGGELLEQTARGEARRQSFQAKADGNVQAVGEEGDEDVRLDARRLLVMDRPDGEVALQGPKRFVDLNELQMVAPQRRRIAFGQVAAQQIAPFAPTRPPRFLEIERIAERGLFRVDLDFDQAPSGRLLGFSLPEFDHEVFARQVGGHPLQVFESRP